jgi:hypothetical protein
VEVWFVRTFHVISEYFMQMIVPFEFLPTVLVNIFVSLSLEVLGLLEPGSGGPIIFQNVTRWKHNSTS